MNENIKVAKAVLDSIKPEMDDASSLILAALAISHSLLAIAELLERQQYLSPNKVVRPSWKQ